MAKREHDDLALEATERLRHERPAVDRVGMEAARERAERALFRDAAPARIGRFVVLERIAAGGMGVVYRARDPQLERDVALKVIHPDHGDDRQARERLLAEARALARLKHPNVVPVYDVIAVEDQVVMVMELVEGQTVTAWEAAQPRTWREVIAVYVAAGRGLAAAHELGLVHRDFKPSNVIVGDDGRVRVIDFGLARAAADGAGAASGAALVSSVLSADTLTATGAIIGTPAYMAPEQMTGGKPSPASDQFSFCVALYQSLFGVRPFTGGDLDVLCAAIRDGAVAPPTTSSRVPSHVRSLVMRGLAFDAAARHPSMSAFLKGLDREHGWRRLRLPIAIIAVGAVVAVGAALGGARQAGVGADGCDRQVGALQPVWSMSRRAALLARLVAIDVPGDEIGRIADGIDVRALEWGPARVRACRQLARRELTARQHAAVERCQDRALDRLQGAIALLTTLDASRAGNALAVVDGLGTVSECDDASQLASAAIARDVDRARLDPIVRRIDEASRLDRAGETSRALQVAADASASAAQAGHLATLLEAELVEGQLLMQGSQWTDAARVLERAQEIALGERPPNVTAAVIAAARLLYVESALGQPVIELLRQSEPFEQMSRDLRDHFARPLLLNNIGLLHRNAGNLAMARTFFENAREARDRASDPDPELSAIEINLGFVTDDAGVRSDLMREGWTRRAAALGRAHPLTLTALRTFASFEDDPAVALPAVIELCDLYRRFHPGQVWDRATMEYARAFLAEELGDRRAAASAYASAATLADALVEERGVWGGLARGHASLLARDPEAARAWFLRVVAELGDDALPYQRLQVADARIGVGRAELELGRGARAIAQLELAVAELEGWKGNVASSIAQRLALARLTLAAALRAAGERGPRPAGLEAAVRDFYVRAGATSYRSRLAEIHGGSSGTQ